MAKLTALILGALALLPSALAAPKKCPTTFSIYITSGGTPGSNVTYYFDEYSTEGHLVRPSPDYGRAYKLYGKEIRSAYNDKKVLYTFVNSEQLLTVTPEIRKQRGPAWEADLRPIKATINPQTCELKLVSQKDRTMIHAMSRQLFLSANDNGTKRKLYVVEPTPYPPEDFKRSAAPEAQADSAAPAAAAADAADADAAEADLVSDAAAAKKCPSKFSIRLGYGNDPSKRDWYINDGALGRTVKLDLGFGNAWKLKNKRLVHAENEQRVLTGFTNSWQLMTVTPELKAQRGAEWVSNLTPVVVRINKRTCKLDVRAEKTRRFFYRAHDEPILSPDPELGSIRWGAHPEAVPHKAPPLDA